MNRFTVCAIVSVLSGGSLVVPASSQSVGRTIVYDHRTPISDRLTAGDTTVAVAKPFPPGPETPFLNEESFDEEVKRLSQSKTIAIVKVVDSGSEFVDGGTWIRTRIHGLVTQLIKPGALVDDSGLIEFWQDGGSTRVGDVTVIAGISAHFTEQQTFLAADPERATTYAALAFHVNTQGVVEPMKLTNGGSFIADSKLIGLPISEVASALAKIK
jgi:hypothetical protein